MFATETRDIVAFVAASNITGVVILSGDTHWGAAYRHGFAEPHVYECSASPFQALPFPHPDTLAVVEPGIKSGDDDGWSETLFLSSMSFHYGVARVSGADKTLTCEIYGFWPWSTPQMLFSSTVAV